MRREERNDGDGLNSRAPLEVAAVSIEFEWCSMPASAPPARGRRDASASEPDVFNAYYRSHWSNVYAKHVTQHDREWHLPYHRYVP